MPILTITNLILMLWKVYLFSYATVSTSWSSHLDSQLHSPLGNPMLLCARMQLVLELYWFRSLSSLGLEVIWGLKRLQYNWWKAAEKGTKNSRVLRRRPRKIRPRSGSLMIDCFHSSLTKKTKKEWGLGWSQVWFSFFALLSGKMLRQSPRAMPSTFTPAPAAYCTSNSESSSNSSESLLQSAASPLGVCRPRRRPRLRRLLHWWVVKGRAKCSD